MWACRHFRAASVRSVARVLLTSKLLRRRSRRPVRSRISVTAMRAAQKSPVGHAAGLLGGWPGVVKLGVTYSPSLYDELGGFESQVGFAFGPKPSGCQLVDAGLFEELFEQCVHRPLLIGLASGHQHLCILHLRG